MIVAIATPATPIWNTITKNKLNRTLTTPAMIRKYSGRLVSPTARKIAAPKLYSKRAGMPRKKMRIYRVAWSMILAGVPIHSNIGRDSKMPMKIIARPETAADNMAVCTPLCTPSASPAP